MKDKEYSIYKVLRTKEEFFSTWETDSLIHLDEQHKEFIYKKYIVKSSVLQRDRFKCQNEKCETPGSELTMHHIKFQKNGGENKLKNCITLCKSCHKNFHRGKRSLTFWGMTYKITDKENEIDWKELRSKTKELRKANKEYWSYKISWEMMAMLLKFLFGPTEEELYEDDVEDDI